MRKLLFVIGIVALLALAACSQTESPPGKEMAELYGQYCAAGIAEVADCSDYVQATYGNLGGGIRWYDKATGDLMDCPVVAPDSMTPGCKALMERQESMACEKVYDCPPASPDGLPDDGQEADYVACPAERPAEPVACTLEYTPVCVDVDNGIRCITAPCPSVDKRTYGNACQACADPKVFGYVPGECPAEESAPETAPKLLVRQYAVCDGNEELAAQIGYECVEACPEGYDSFMTRPGIERCIAHVGEAEIDAAAHCSSRLDCTSEQECILADRTTDGQEVAFASRDEGFRCMLQPYFDFRLHSDGATVLNEKGHEGTAIA